MYVEGNLGRILDDTVKDISQKVAKIDVVKVNDMECDSMCNPCSFYTETNGDYKLTVVLCTDYEVLMELTRNMKRSGEATEEDIPVYAGEFFNILCGRLVSSVNQEKHLNAFFGVPSFIQGEYDKLDSLDKKIQYKHCYNSPFGHIEVETLSG